MWRETSALMNDATFRDFVLDQLQRLGEVDCRRMFGAYGLYHDADAATPEVTPV
jgi:hypothetical protein